MTTRNTSAKGHAMGTLATQSRPLAKLAPLIRRELKSGFQAGERHWKIAGRLLNEARQHFTRKGLPNSGKGPTWHEWVDANFDAPLDRRTAGTNNCQRLDGSV